MATRPGSSPAEFATNATYVGGPAIKVGDPVKVAPPTNFYEDGFKVSDPFTAQWANYLWNQWSEWVVWTSQGSNAGGADTHIVETDANGRTTLKGATLTGNGGASGALIVSTSAATKGIAVTTSGSATKAIDVTHSGADVACSIAASAGEALAVTCTDTALTDGVTIDRSGGTAGSFALVVSSDTSGVAINSTATGNYALTVGSTSTISGALFDNSSSGIALAATSNTGKTATFENSAGTADTVTMTCGSSGAALCLEPQASTTTDRAGQIWTENESADVGWLRFCNNATGLDALPHKYVAIGLVPLFIVSDTDSGLTTHNENGASVTYTLCEVQIRPQGLENSGASQTFTIRGATNNVTTITGGITQVQLELYDVTNAASLETLRIDHALAPYIGNTIAYTGSWSAAATIRLRITISGSLTTGRFVTRSSSLIAHHKEFTI